MAPYRTREKSMKLMILWHAGAIDVYYDRYTALRQYFDRVYVVVPGGWREVQDVPEDRDGIFFIKTSAMFTFHPLPIIHHQLRRIIADVEPDYLYLHEEPHSLSAFQAALIARRLSIPFCVDSALINMRLFLGGCNRLEQYIYRHADRVYYRNDNCREVLVKRNCPVDKLAGPMPNGVSTRAFRPLDRHEKEGFLKERGIRTLEGFVIGFAGRIVPEKGIDLLLDLADEDTRVRVCLCGDLEDDRYRERILDHPRVEWFGRLNREDLNAFYNVCEVTVLPSRPTRGWTEQFGRVLIESIMAGTPALGSRIGMIPEIIGEENAFDPLSYHEFRERIYDFMDVDWREKVLAAQRNHVGDNYTWEVIARRVYEDISG
jgi:glycosyltransferase involved in cell wall biosynthesis